MSDLNLKKVKSVRRFEQVSQQIWSLILEGHLEPGDKLPGEVALSEALGVGRSSVREALRALESKKLIAVRDGAGTFVAHPRFSAPREAVAWLASRGDSLEDLLEVRGVLEALTVSRAATLASDEQVEDLKRICRRMAELEHDPGNLVEEAKLDVAFHTTIAEASANDVAKQIISEIHPAFADANRAVLYLSESMEKTEKEHCQIVDAIVNRDPQEAEAAMRAHIARVRSEVRTVMGGEERKDG